VKQKLTTMVPDTRQESSSCPGGEGGIVRTPCCVFGFYLRFSSQFIRQEHKRPCRSARISPRIFPFLRRYARALTGTQQHGDAYVRATLEAIVAAPGDFPRDVDVRLGLYRTFQRIWGSVNGEGATPTMAIPMPASPMPASPRSRRVSRQALLLTQLEGFTPEDAAYLMDETAANVEELVARCRRRDRASDPRRRADHRGRADHRDGSGDDRPRSRP
jgi:hypothetical protein